MNPECQLYLVSPPALDADVEAALDAALGAGDVTAFLLRLPDADETSLLRAIERLRPRVQATGTAFLLEGDPVLAARSGCDGAHVSDPTFLPRKPIGDLQLGVSCGLSRDLAMRAGEAGADYVAFGPFAAGDETILTWWSELMELPCVAEGRGITAQTCPPLVRAGADFLAVDDAVWHHPGGPAEGLRAMLAAIAAAGEGNAG